MADLILEVIEGTDAGRQVDLSGPVEIGRDHDAGLPLPQDTQASRRHVRVTPQSGQAFVEDLGSTNGTFVNDQVIHSRHPIWPGDRLRVGLTVVQLRSAQQVRERVSAAVPRPPIPTPPPAPPGPPPPAAGPLPQPAPPPAAPVPAAAAQAAVPVRRAETPAGYVPPEVVGDPAAESDYAALSHLVDTRVKPRGYIAAFALIGAAALGLILIFGLQ